MKRFMDTDEFEDYLELRNPKMQAQIKENFSEYVMGRSRPAGEFLEELRELARRQQEKRDPI